MNKKVENIFVYSELTFLLTTGLLALYAVFNDKSLYIWVILLGLYVFTIKGLKHIFTNPQNLKKNATKIKATTYLSVSFVGSAIVFYEVIKAITL